MVELPPPRDGRAGTTRSYPDPVIDLPQLLGAAVPPAERGEDFVNAVVSGARDFLGMDVAFVGEFTEGQRVFRYVDKSSGCPAVQVGGADELENTYCQRVIDGRLPGMIADTATVPAAAALPGTRELPVGAHLSVPILLSDGSVYGTFCSFAHDSRENLQTRDLAVMRMLAALIAGHLEQQRDARLHRGAQRARIQRAIAEHAFRIVYQPIVDLRTDAVIGFEALTRFATGSPADWFAMAADCGAAAVLELATLQAAVEGAARLPTGSYLAVNLSPTALCSPEFDAIAPSLPWDRLVVELTEQASVDRDAEVLGRVRMLRARGARIAVDDAGAGHSGLQRILAVAPDIVKLDRDLISGIDRDPARQALARAMHWFADRGEKSLVAEGIETPAERATLVRLGVRYGQGYLLGRPGELPLLLAATGAGAPAATGGQQSTG